MTAYIASLADVKTHLRFSNPTQPHPDDPIVQGLIDSATGVIEYHCDDVLPHLHDEYYDGGDTSVFVRHKPILSVENVEEGWGYINFELDYVEVNSPPPYSMFAYSIDNYETGEISRRSAGNIVIPYRAGQANIRVQYQSGRQVVPPVLVLALKTLVGHWWRNEELRSLASDGAYQQYDVTTQSFAFSRETSTTSVWFGVPASIIDMIQSERRAPIIA